MIETAKIVLNWLNEHHIQVELLNLGGGFGIKYVEGDVSFLLKKVSLKLQMRLNLNQKN